MTERPAELSARSAALLAGWSYALVFALAIFANFGVRERLVEPGDAAATAANVAESETLFRLALAAFLLVVLLDVLVAWALYVLFRPAHAGLSLLAAWFRIAHAVVMGVALVFFFLVLELVGGGTYATALGAGGRDAQVALFLEAFDDLWLVGLLAFGVHLGLLGLLVLRSSLAPRAIGWLLVVAGAAYAVDTMAHAVLAAYDDYETLFAVLVVVPAVVGELSFAVWLLLRGGSRATRARAAPAGARLRPAGR